MPLQPHDCVRLADWPDGETFAVLSISSDGACHIESLPVPGFRWHHRVKGSDLIRVPAPCAKLHTRADVIAMGRCSVCGRKL